MIINLEHSNSFHETIRILDAMLRITGFTNKMKVTAKVIDFSACNHGLMNMNHNDRSTTAKSIEAESLHVFSKT